MNNHSNINKGFKEQLNLTFVLVAWRLPQCITALLSARFSGSMVMWMEFVEKICIVIPGILLGILSVQLNKNLKLHFNYGTGKVEAITALCCEMFDFAGLLFVVMFAIHRLRHPGAATSNSLSAILFCTAGLLIDIFIFVQQKNLADKHHNKVIHAAFLSIKKEFAFDIIAFVTLLLELALESVHHAVYISPVCCLLLSIPFAWIIIHHSVESLKELSDMTLDEQWRLNIMKVLSDFSPSYDKLGEIYSRKSGEEIFIEIELSFPAEMNYGFVHTTANQIKQRLHDELGQCRVNIVVI